VIFSFFKKPPPKEPESPISVKGSTSTAALPSSKELADIAAWPEDLTQPQPKTPRSPDSAFAARQNAPIGVDPKALARAAVAKIDAIESEMSLDFVGRKGASVLAPKVEGGQKILGGLPAEALRPVEKRTVSRVEYPGETPDWDSPTQTLLGDSVLSSAMGITEGTTAPAVEEAAVLYANHLVGPATDVLKSAIAEESLGRSEFSAYQMLFDLLHLQGAKDDYEKYALDFVVKFEQSAPAWRDRKPTPPASTASFAPMIHFRDALDASIVPQLERIKQLATKHAKLRLEFSNIKSADVVGCELMLRVLSAFSLANHEIELNGTEPLINAVKSLLEVGRKDASPAAWDLLLKLYQITDRQKPFEDVAVDYCVTYEVSPPSWEPPPKNVHVVDSSPGGFANSMIEGGLPDEIPLTGEIKGNAEALIKTIESAFLTRNTVILNCKALERIEFSAAGSLLIPLTQWSNSGKQIEFRELNHLIAGLFITLGIHQLATVQRRK
jgi:anti-anti-sigma regulatory factor